MTELWKTVDEFPAYEVSNFGRFRRLVGGQGAQQGRILSWNTCTSSGYPVIRFVSAGRQHARTVHKMVSRAFLGPMPDGHVVRHMDGDKLNNCAGNLAYGTIAENNGDKVRHGTSGAGERNPRAKLTAAQVAMLRVDYGLGFNANELAKAYLISESTVYRIVRGIYWKEASNRAMDKGTQ